MVEENDEISEKPALPLTVGRVLEEAEASMVNEACKEPVAATLSLALPLVEATEEGLTVTIAVELVEARKLPLPPAVGVVVPAADPEAAQPEAVPCPLGEAAALTVAPDGVIKPVGDCEEEPLLLADGAGLDEIGADKLNDGDEVKVEAPLSE